MRNVKVSSGKLHNFSENIEKFLKKEDNFQIQKLCGIGWITPFEELTRDKGSKGANLIIINGRLRASKTLEKINPEIRQRFSDGGVQRAIQLYHSLRENQMYETTPILITPYEFEENKDYIDFEKSFPEDKNFGTITQYVATHNSALQEIIESHLR